jgi:hypothetical protein
VHCRWDRATPARRAASSTTLVSLHEPDTAEIALISASDQELARARNIAKAAGRPDVLGLTKAIARAVAPRSSNARRAKEDRDHRRVPPDAYVSQRFPRLALE